jgi:hypothetical protein
MAEKVRTDGHGRELYPWEADPTAGVPKKKDAGVHPVARQAVDVEQTTRAKERKLVEDEG